MNTNMNLHPTQAEIATATATAIAHLESVGYDDAGYYAVRGDMGDRHGEGNGTHNVSLDADRPVSWNPATGEFLVPLRFEYSHGSKYDEDCGDDDGDYGDEVTDDESCDILVTVGGSARQLVATDVLASPAMDGTIAGFEELVA